MKNQSISGIKIEHIIIQEAKNFEDFYTSDSIHCVIKRQPLSNDYGAAAKDEGLKLAKGEYACFFDDDNIYYPHALSTLYSTVLNHDIGICKVRYKDRVIPSANKIECCDIDTMCFIVRASLAKQVEWAGGGRFSDYRFINNVKNLTCDIIYNEIIIGEHL
jgi:glycosyltransferase involved in cell wall biosynthesis